MTTPLSSLEKFVDVPELLDRVENDQDLLIELFTILQQDLNASRLALDIAVANSNLLEIEHTAHTVKGMLANLSVKHISSLAAAIESAAHERDSLKVQKTMMAFESEIADFSSSVASFLGGRQS